MIDTYGELDVLFITTPSIQNPSISKKCKDKTYKKSKRQLENGRVRSKEFRDRRKAQFRSSIEYSESLLKQNEKLKQQICLLKHQLNKLIVLCQKTKTLKNS